MLTQLFRTTRSGRQVLVGSRMLESGTSGSERGQWSIGHGYINLIPRDPGLLAQNLFVAAFSFKSCVRFGSS